MNLHVFARNLPFSQFLCILVQLPGHPVSKIAIWEGVVHIQDIIFVKAQLLLHLCHPLIKCSEVRCRIKQLGWMNSERPSLWMNWVENVNYSTVKLTLLHTAEYIKVLRCS